MKQLVLFDIDGTLADIKHRLHHLEHDRHNWGAFFAEMGDDAPNTPIVDLYKALHASGVYELVIVTARPDNYREVTELWLTFNDIEFDTLHMRIDGDRRPDVDVKMEILQTIRAQGRDIAFVVDDRKSVVDMWRKEGITCLECADHDF